MRSLPLYLLLAVLAFAAVGCADPAADAPDATVAEPAAEPAPAATEMAETYDLAGTIGFVGSKVTGSHDGGFESFTGTVSVVGGTPEGSSVEVTIDTTSLWSDNDNLTGHLKSADFFDVENHPTASFKSTGITANEEGADGTHTLTGNLDLHGVTKQISFPANIEVTDAGFSANAEFSINRMDFNIVYPGKPDDLIREEVLIKLDLKSADDMGGEMEGEAMESDNMDAEGMEGEGEEAEG